MFPLDPAGPSLQLGDESLGTSPHVLCERVAVVWTSLHRMSLCSGFEGVSQASLAARPGRLESPMELWVLISTFNPESFSTVHSRAPAGGSTPAGLQWS